MVRFRNRIANFGIFAFCLLVPVASLLADGIIRDGVGAISTGRGGTNLAFSDNGNIIVDNPGALVNIQGTGLNEIGLDVLFTDLSYKDPENGWTNSANNPFPVGEFSLVRRAPNGKWAWGFGGFSIAGFSTKYRMNGPAPFSGPQHYKSVGALMRILPSLAVSVTPRWSIGGTIGVAVSHTELEGPYSTNYPGPGYGTPTIMDTQGTGAGLSWSVGSQYLISDRTAVGVSYQGETHIRQDGTTSLTIPGMGTSRFDSKMSTEWPSTLGIGLSHSLSSRNLVSVDVIWTRWSTSKDRYDMTLTNPSNPVFAAVLGPVVREYFPFNWDDSVAVRTGFQRLLRNGHIFRTGYVYHDNPIPTGTLTPFVQATVEHAVSVGYGFQYGSYGVDLGYQFTWGPDVSVETSDFAGYDFDGSMSSASAHWALMSLVRRF